MAPYLLFLSLAFIAQAQDKIELSPFGGASLFQNSFANGGIVGGRAAWNFSDHFALEANYDFSVNNARLSAPGNFGNRIQSLSIDPLYHFTPRYARFRPYVTAGVGPSWFSPTKQARAFFPALTRSTELAVNYGGGLKYNLMPHVGLRLDARGVFGPNPSFGIANVPGSHLNSLQATAGLIFSFWSAPALLEDAPVVTEPKPTLQPLNPGELTGATGQLCQGRVLALHSTATDPAGHTLTYKWKANGMSVGTNDPDLSYNPNNAGDFQFEVEVADVSDPSRSVRIGPKTLSVGDYVPPKIKGITASPNSVSMSGDAPPDQTVILAADVASTVCGGNLTYKWAVSEGALTNAAGPSAVFETSSLNFDSGLGQTKTITATLTATDETGQATSQNVNFVIDYPAQFKRLPDVIFAKDSARVNNCGKRLLIEQAAPQAGTAFDILLVGHRTGDEVESVPSNGRGALRSSSLDRQRLLSVAAVLTGGHGVCGHLDLSQVRFYAAGIEQISPVEPGFCGTSTIPHTNERRGSEVSEADKDRRVELYLVPKGSQALPPGARHGVVVTPMAVKALGCPQ